MTHLIYYQNEFWFTRWYNPEYHADGMIAIDIVNNLWTKDGKEWKEIDFDHL